MKDLYYLGRKQDGTGVHGDLSIAIPNEPDRDIRHVHDARPQVGMLLFVGSESNHGGFVAIVDFVYQPRVCHHQFQT
jgi:hypothetical protein